MNTQEVKRTLEIFKRPGEIVEVRIVGKVTSSGYFKDPDKLLEAVKGVRGKNIYFVMNRICDACYSREQSEKIIDKPKQTTSDNDIAHRDWFLIDIDSKRPAGVSATEEERTASKEIANGVYQFLKGVGFWEPVCCDSGNGYHLLYKIDFENTPQVTKLLKDVLEVLNMLYSTNQAEIDTKVFNPGRITKLYGTIACKGSSTQERPHRESKIIRVPPEIKPTGKECFETLAALLPKPEQKSYDAYTKRPFDLREWLSRHDIPVRCEENYNGGTRFVLEHCPFDENHKGKDAVLFLNANGAIAFHCFHNSCRDHKWQDLRRMYEPDAYDREEEWGLKAQKGKEKEPRIEDVTIKDANRFLTATEIKARDRSRIVTIKSGFDLLDKKIIGFNKGELSIWSGANGSGKSSVLSQLALEAVQRKFKVAMFSGELRADRILEWLQLQCAGKYHTHSTQYENYFYVDRETKEKISRWLDGKIYIYNNDFGAKISEVVRAFKDCVKEKEIDVIIIDNLMSLDLADMGGEKYDRQSTLVNSLSQLAKQYNVHIHFVCHPRKTIGFLRKTDISGTSDITNAADNVFIIHRVNADFKRITKTELKFKDDNPLYGYDNIIEICKNRDLGVADLFVGLYFELESKRLLNQRTEERHYDWETEEKGFTEIKDILVNPPF